MFALRQALFYIKRYTIQNYVIFTDSQSAISLIDGYSKSYVVIVNDIKNLLIKLNESREVIIHWVKGHSGIVGNEIADKAANMGHANDSSVRDSLTKEELYSYMKIKFNEYWDHYWKFTTSSSGKGLHLREIRGNVMQSVSTFKMKNRWQESMIFRLRVGHAGVNKYLYRIGLKDSPIVWTLQ